LPEHQAAFARLGRTESSHLLRKKIPPCPVGFDVSKDQRDIACRPEHMRSSVAIDSAGVAEILNVVMRLLKMKKMDKLPNV
jgi:hypothetical protein